MGLLRLNNLKYLLVQPNLALKSMPIIDIFTNTFLGISHSGNVSVDGEGTVNLTDEEVQQLINLIRENSGETDVEKLELEDKYPAIFEKLDDAYHEIAHSAAYHHFVIEVFENGDYDLSIDEIIENCEKYGFEFEYDPKDFLYDDEEDEIDEDALEEAKSDALYEWVDKYRSHLNDFDDALFLAEVFHIDVYLDAIDIVYSVEIPPEIIEMAKSE